MMRLGVFAKTYVRPSVEETFQAAARDGFTCVQFNLVCAGLATLPNDPVPETMTRKIRRAAELNGIQIAAVSGTFNMAHPAASFRRDGLRRLGNLISWAGGSGVPVVTLCSGSRDPVDMWREHRESSSPQAWNDFVDTLTPALAAAEAVGVTLAIEPEPANVVNGAPAARRLLDQLHSAHLKLILDPANLADGNSPASDWQLLAESVDLLAVDTVLVHAKDRLVNGPVCPAGQGVVDFSRFLRRLHLAGFNGPLVVHGIGESEIPTAVSHLRAVLGAIAPESSHAIS